jgi:hypothetical protein
MSLEERCRAVWVVIFETGRALAFVMLEGGRAINDGAMHPELLIPNVELEPTPPCDDRILSPARLSLAWYWAHSENKSKALEVRRECRRVG